jgi:hypothetical protein
MKKIFGKWLLDVAKYVATAVILSSVFSEISQKWMMLLISGLSVCFLLLSGLFLIKYSKKED